MGVASGTACYRLFAADGLGCGRAPPRLFADQCAAAIVGSDLCAVMHPGNHGLAPVVDWIGGSAYASPGAAYLARDGYSRVSVAAADNTADYGIGNRRNPQQ
jgi:hypothetical protein